MVILGGVVGEFVAAQQGPSDLILQYGSRWVARVFAILIILAAMDITPPTGVRMHRRMLFLAHARP